MSVREQRPPETKPFSIPQSDLVGRRHDRYLEGSFNYGKAYFTYDECMNFGKSYFKMLFYTREADDKEWSEGLPQSVTRYGMETAAFKLA